MVIRMRTAKPGLPAISLAAFCFLSAGLLAQTPAVRIKADIDNSERATITGTHPPMATSANDIGPVGTGAELHGMSLVFSRSADQEARLERLIAAQQDSTSPLYHKWLSPEEFGAEFGVATADITKVEDWLEQQGFSVDGISRSRNRIIFSGTVGQITSTFGAALHYYKTQSQKHYAPSSDISVPVALADIVQNVGNLSNFRPKPRVKFNPDFTSSQSGSHFLTPKDVATIYDVNPAYNAGYTGAGQSIAVVGQSSISVSDIEHFQSAAGLTKKDPTLILVPNSGTAAVSSGDESESDLDLEYSGGIATGATVYFIYVGNNSNYSVWDSITYAVDNRTAPIISSSYGDCETDLGSANYSSLNSVLAQAATQGQTIAAPSGDSGSTDCYGYSTLTTAAQETLAVDFPASSQYVTGMGGTEFSSSAVSSSNTSYWESASGSDVISSALSYIPEQVWNDDSSTNGLSSAGGGASNFTARPRWQTGVPGIPSGSYRLVPDISLDASPNNAGYLFCSSDSSATGITGSCSNGFRDSNNTYLTVAGGTSFGVPIFSGMMAILNQKLNSSGQGVVNSTLYTLASNSTTYASAFHDITSGSNACTAGANYCSSAGESGFSATAGYDEASGLGSVNFYNLLQAWPGSSSSLVASQTTLSAAISSPASGASDAITVTVSSASSSATSTPTGSLTIAVDGTTQTSSLTLSNGSATYAFSSTTTGSHVITATYSGDSSYASSSGTLSLTVGGSSSPSFTLSATSVAVAAGSTGTSTITVTPKGGYTGTVGWSISSNTTLSNVCFSVANATVSDTSAVTTTLTIATSSTACANGAVRGTSGKRSFRGASPSVFRNDHAYLAGISLQGSLAMVGVLIAGIGSCSPRKRRRAAGVSCIALLGVILIGCGGSSSSTSTSNATKGTYTLTIVGTDTSSSSITASTTMTVTID